MTRDLDEATLKQAARDYAGQYLLPTVNHPYNPTHRPIGGRGFVLTSMENFHFEDEFNYIRHEMEKYLGPTALAEFKEDAAKHFTPYDSGEHEHNLAERLAIDPHGKTIPNKIGKVRRGQMVIGFRYQNFVWKWIDNKKIKVPTMLAAPVLVFADVHIGEDPEQARDRALALHASHGEIIFPINQMPAVMALAPRISNAVAKSACDAVVDSIDGGSGAGIIQGRSGAQPADPDTTVSGTLLFTLVYTDPAFGNAADANPGGRATASTITSDSSADATATLGYCRAFSSNDGATALLAIFDGEAGTGTADYVFNTTAIVSGATVALTSQTVTVPES